MTKINIANPSERAFQRNSFLFWFGAYGSTYVLAYGAHLEDALESAVDWIVDNEPGHLMDDEVQEAYERAIAEGKDEEEAIEEAEMDMTGFGHSGMHYLASWEWGIVVESPTKSQLIEIYRGR